MHIPLTLLEAGILKSRPVAHPVELLHMLSQVAILGGEYLGLPLKFGSISECLSYSDFPDSHPILSELSTIGVMVVPSLMQRVSVVH